MAAARSPGPVPQEALDYFRAKDLRPGFDYRDVWGEEHAHAFTVAKALRLDILDDIRSALDAALAEGQTFRQFAKQIKPTLQRKGWWGIQAAIDPATGEKRLVQLGSPRRLKTIYRANLRSARAAGQWQRIQRTKASQPYLVYLLGPSRNHRDAHVTLQGLTLPVDDPAWQTVYPPNGYNCFPADTIVRCNARLALKTWYAGKMVELHTRGGHRLTVTANHPVLTARGWIAAHRLREGDHLIGARPDVDAGLAGVVDDEQPPARAEDLFESLAAQGLRVVEMAPHDFHGDARLRKPEIHVAGADGGLVDVVDRPPREFVGEGRFEGRLHGWVEAADVAVGAAQTAPVVGDAAPAQHVAHGWLGNAQALGDGGLADQTASVQRQDLALGGVVAGVGGAPGGAQQAPGLAAGLDADPALPPGRAAPAPGDAAPVKHPLQRPPAESELYRELLEANAGLVSADEIVFVREFDWAGHVYDFATDSGRIVAGGLVVSNCKCHVRQITRAAADDYQRDGVPDATAAQEVDPATGLPTGRRVTQRVPAQTRMPALKQKRWVNKRTSEVSYAPEGIHPGWANNSGQARVRVLREHLIGRMDSADEHLARYAVLDVVGSPVYRAFRRDVARYRELLRNRDLPNAQRKARAARIGEFPVGVLRRDDMARLGLHTQMVRLSPEDFAKQVAKHGELGRDDYLAVVDALDRGRAAYDAEDGKLFYFLRVADSTSEKGDPRRYRMALVRITKDRRKLYLQSYRIARQQDVDAAMAALEPLRRREEKEKR